MAASGRSLPIMVSNRSGQTHAIGGQSECKRMVKCKAIPQLVGFEVFKLVNISLLKNARVLRMHQSISSSVLTGDRSMWVCLKRRANGV